MNYPPPGNQLRRIVLGILIASLSILYARSAAAQAVVFPTDGVCHQGFFSIPTAGGEMYLPYGGEFLSFQGTPTLITCFANFIDMGYNPPAIQASFTIKNFGPVTEVFTVSTPTGDLTYTLPASGTQGVNIEGDSIPATFVTCPGCSLGFLGIMNLSITQAQPDEIQVKDGNNQRGVISNAVEKPLRVQFSNARAGAAVTFAITNAPSTATGYAVGADERSTTSSYTATTDGSGVASAVLVLGDQAGAYTVEASIATSVSGTPAIFTATALKPDSVAILKDSTDLADRADSYAVPSDQPSPFFAVGLDKAGQKIGPVKCGWSTAAGGNPSTRGSGSVNPSTTSSTTAFSPTKVGHLTISANPPFSGVSTAKADLYITSLYVDLDNSFSVSNPVDQKDKFVPGVTAAGNDIPLATMTGGGQAVKLHILTGPGAKGQVAFSVNASHFPGVAMNYPINNPDTGPDMTLVGGTSITVPFANDGDTVAMLTVRDYAATGTITVMVTAGKKTYSLKQRLPTDNGFGLPSAGWPTTAGHINTIDMHDNDDVDDQPAGQTGDGLSNFEEYRGFVAAMTHVRTDPHKRDIFVAADPQFLVGTVTTPTVTTTLPFPVRYLDLSEVAGEDYSGRAITKGKAVVDPNRAGIPGARSVGQRAVRLVMQVQYPPAVTVEIAPGVLQNAPAWQVGIFGATILDSTNPDIIDQAASGGAATFSAESPDTTRWSEVYERTFTNSGIATNFTNLLFNDENGQPVPPCPSAGTITGCDEYDFAHHLVLPRIFPGGIFELHSVPYSDDWYSKRMVTCADQANLVDYGVTDAEMHAARLITGAHELGHSLHIDHTVVCGNLMFAFNMPPFPSVGMIDIRPFPIFFSSDEASQIQLRP
jgi:hypothetical protein